MTYKEEIEISKKVMDLNRARQSLIEELEAIMWYDGRADATTDESLREILIHNRDDEKEHMSLLLEWLRRNDPNFEKEMKEFLFKKEDLRKLWD